MLSANGHNRGGLFLVRNRRTQEAAYFEAREGTPYRGQTLLYGDMRPHMIRVQRGIREIEGKPTCIPLLRPAVFDARAWNMAVLGTGGDEGTGVPDRHWISAIAGSPTATGPIKVVESEERPILVCGKQIFEFWGGRPWLDAARSQPNRDGLIRATRHFLDLYFACRGKVELPAWFLDERRACLAGRSL